ncbi:threonine/serine exporter family protein [Lactobacillus sp. ESL0791]|uniref:threonine/serine exporter family protein n=1 Tax=Lactobacillus sp. ESL0791 TaxID=2983234 RepID=UPI0023F91B20|nr:threonine/serine exporter family protein [Lactobacillus sp. ESL0791]MDF7638673.1 threonine/serine exporter family protein [Lactobacillus sp. ESL0791]
MTWYHFIIQLTFSYLGTVAFGFFINLPKKALNVSGITASIGWILYWLIFEFQLGAILANFVAAFVVGLLGIFFAKKKKMPSTMFVSALVPLVPGASGYQAIEAFISHTTLLAIEKTVHVAMVAGAIAFGYVFSQVVAELLRARKKRRS